MKKIVQHKKKVILLLFILLIISYMAGIFDIRPFKFEKYYNQEKAQAYLENKYPVGSDYKLVVNDLKVSGGKCKVLPQEKIKHDLHNSKEVIHCTYNTGLFSFPQLTDYLIGVGSNEYGKITFIGIHIEYVGP